MTLVKKLEKHLANKADFGSILQLCFSNLRLKLCERPESCKNCEWNQDWRGLGWLTSNKLCLETISHKVFEAHSSFYMKKQNKGAKRINRSENIVWNKNTNKCKTGKTGISSLLFVKTFSKCLLIHNKSAKIFKS